MSYKDIYILLSDNKELFHVIYNITSQYKSITYASVCISYLFHIINFIPFYAIYTFSLIATYVRPSYNKKIQYKEDDVYLISGKLYTMGLSYVMFVITFTILKFTLAMPRPFCSTKIDYLVTSVANVYCNSSFPSAHSGLALMVLWALWDRVGYLYKIVMIFVTAFVGVSRIALAMHYPLDVIGGYVIAALVIHISSICMRAFLKQGDISYGFSNTYT